MPRFSEISAINLSQCHEDLQALFNEVVKTFDCSVICGHRGQEEQMAALINGQTKLPWPKSKHNSQPSLAIDAGPYPIDWEDSARFVYFAGYVMAVADRLFREGKIRNRIRWGGDWDRDRKLKEESFKDLPHFEII